MESDHETHSGLNHRKPAHYKKLLLMAILSFIAMYILMYAMVNSYENIFPNINQFYMAALMTMPMLIIELLLMKDMYTNKNTILLLWR